MNKRIGWISFLAIGGFVFFSSPGWADDPNPIDEAIKLHDEIHKAQDDIKEVDRQTEDRLENSSSAWGVPEGTPDPLTPLRDKKNALTQSIANAGAKLDKIKADAEKEKEENRAAGFRDGQTFAKLEQAYANVQEAGATLGALANKLLDQPVTPAQPTAPGVYQDEAGKQFFIAPGGKRYDYSYALPSAEGGMSTHFVDPDDQNKGYIIDSAGVHQAQKMAEPGAWDMGVAVRTPTGQFNSAIGTIDQQGHAIINPNSGTGFGNDFSPVVQAPVPQTVGDALKKALQPAKDSVSNVGNTLVGMPAPVVSTVGKIAWPNGVGERWLLLKGMGL